MAIDEHCPRHESDEEDGDGDRDFHQSAVCAPW